MEDEAEKTLRAACNRDRKFQLKKTREFAFVHEVLNDDSLNAEEKILRLVVEGGYGKMRARELVYGQ